MADNVINLMERLKQKNAKETDLNKNDQIVMQTSEITDISEQRQKTIAEDRREVKRTILTEFIGTHLVLPGLGLIKVSLFDVSTMGVSFDLEKKFGFFKETDEIAMRIYLNHDAYFPFQLKVMNTRFDQDEQVYRHGAHFINGSVNEEALYFFVRFLETVSTSLRKDDGDILVSNVTT